MALFEDDAPTASDVLPAGILLGMLGCFFRFVGDDLLPVLDADAAAAALEALPAGN